ncbi:MAG: pentapeptide repeat-containing protein [Crocosphaera sp.]
MNKSEEFLELLKKDVTAWNRWRQENSQVEINFESVDLSNSHLSQANLKGINFKRSNFGGSDLRQADLSDSCLKGANFEQCDLRNARLKQANLANANLKAVKLSDANLISANLSRAIIIDARLMNADLRFTNLSYAILTKTDLSSSDLEGANLQKASLDNVNLERCILDKASLENAILKQSSLKLSSLIETNLREVNLNQANLQEAILKDADLSQASLISADLQMADLRKANLSTANFANANLSLAELTGACLEDWNINKATNLDGIVCDYIYLKSGYQERYPYDSNKVFTQGEFSSLYQQASETLDLIFNGSIDWKTFAKSLSDLQVEAGDYSLSVQSIEKKTNGSFLIRVSVPSQIDKEKIEESFWNKYNLILDAKNDQINFLNQEIDLKRNEIITKQKENDRLLKLVETMASTDKSQASHNTTIPLPTSTMNFYYSGASGDINTVIGDRNQQDTIVNNPQRNLAEAAAEIQQLLEQLESTYQSDYSVNSTLGKMLLASKAIQEIENDKSWKERAIKAVQQGSLEALISHPVGGFIASAIQDWKETDEMKQDNDDS